MGTDPTPPPTPTPTLQSLLQPPPVTAINSDTEDRTWAMLCHLGGIIGFFLIPLVLWNMKRQESRYVDDQGKEALNFQLTLLIGDLIGFLFFFIWVYLALFIWIPVWGMRVGLSLLAAMAANQGQVYRYPFALRLVK